MSMLKRVWFVASVIAALAALVAASQVLPRSMSAGLPEGMPRVTAVALVGSGEEAHVEALEAVIRPN